MPVAGAVVNVTTNGHIAIHVEQISQDPVKATSTVEVWGAIKNRGGYTVYHPVKNINATITGYAFFAGPPFGFVINPEESYIFVGSTFTVPHETDGNKSVSFTVHYGVTDTWEFGDNKSVAVSLALDRIPRRPGPPSAPILSDMTSTSVFISWEESTTDGGSEIIGHVVRRYNGFTTTGSFKDYWVPNGDDAMSLLVEDLTPGAVYTFVVFAKNFSLEQQGWSVASAPTSTLPLGGSDIRSNGVWKTAVPYVRKNGKWLIAIPYVRKLGVWKRAN